jgi:hypothetical protein
MCAFIDKGDGFTNYILLLVSREVLTFYSFVYSIYRARISTAYITNPIKVEVAMKTKAIPAVLFTVLLLLGGCVYGGAPYYAQDANYAQYQAQYAPQQVAPFGCIPPYYPVWNGCALPMPRPYIAPMYTGGLLYPVEPFLQFRFNFGGGHGGGKHHRGGRHHRGR